MTSESISIIIKAFEEMIPFNRHLGIKVEKVVPNEILLRLPYDDYLIGNPFLPALHGGVIATLLDTAGGGAALTTLTSVEDKISTLDMRVDYLTRGQSADLFAFARVVRSGNRTVLTHMTAYHDSVDLPIAEGRAVYNVRRSEELTG